MKCTKLMYSDQSITWRLNGGLQYGHEGCNTSRISLIPITVIANESRDTFSEERPLLPDPVPILNCVSPFQISDT